MRIFPLVVAVALFGVLGDVMINQWAKSHQVWWYLVSIPVWVMTATIFGIALREKHYSFGLTVVVILLIHSGMVLVWDAIVERATLTLTQWTGVVAAIAAIVLMEIGRE